MVSLLGGWHKSFAEVGQDHRGLVKLDVLASSSGPGWNHYVRGNTGRERQLPFVPDDPHRLQHRASKGVVKLIRGAVKLCSLAVRGGCFQGVDRRGHNLSCA